MLRITWYALLAVIALVATIGGRAQAPKAQTVEAKVRELATIDGDTSGFVLLPSGRTLIHSVVTDGNNPFGARVSDSTFAYDIATKRRTLLGTNMFPASVSSRGDRLAFTRSSADGTVGFVWTMPIDPKTGIGTGQAQRVTLRPSSVRERASFSPDGKMLTYFAGPRPDGTWDLNLIPAAGGPEQLVANYPARTRHGWSADGKSLYVENPDGQTAIGRVPLTGGQTTRLFSRPAANAVGLSPDEGVAFFLANPDRFFYRTASGLEEKISVALPPSDDGWGYNLTLDPTTMRYTTMTQVRSQGGSYTSKIFEIDFAAAFQAIVKR